ncbi:hypothetical protein ACFX1T_032617 [Malus domestica]
MENETADTRRVGALGDAAAGRELSFRIVEEVRREAVRERRVGEVSGSEMAAAMAPMTLTVGAAVLCT